MSKTGITMMDSDYQIDDSDSSEYKVSTRKRKAHYSTQTSVKRYHKIPIRTQSLLFEMVFQQGKKIKQVKKLFKFLNIKVAKDLKINYSSAKSLIHYYKTKKRPAPEQVMQLLCTKRCAKYKVLSSISQSRMNVEVRINRTLVDCYNYSEKLASINSQLLL